PRSDNRLSGTPRKHVQRPRCREARFKDSDPCFACSRGGADRALANQYFQASTFSCGCSISCLQRLQSAQVVLVLPFSELPACISECCQESLIRQVFKCLVDPLDERGRCKGKIGVPLVIKSERFRTVASNRRHTHSNQGGVQFMPFAIKFEPWPSF